MPPQEEFDISDLNLPSIAQTPLEYTKPLPDTPIKHGRKPSLKLSPSSPDISKQTFPKPVRGLSRSQTLPRVSSLAIGTRAARRRNPGIDDLVDDAVTTANLRRWIRGIVIVDFDLDEGPVINGVCPSFDLPDAAWENIAFSAFPESLQQEQCSLSHSFKLRDTTSPPEDGYLFGFSHFTRRKDPTSKRGYSQRSVVVIANRPYPGLFTAVASKIATAYDEHGSPMLETACQNIANWPAPMPGLTLLLGIVGVVLDVALPRSEGEQQLIEGTASPPRGDNQALIIASSTPCLPPPIELFEATLGNLWSMWEILLLCNEGFLVFGASPSATSQAVWWFRDILQPIPSAHDLRPYFTLQDQEHGSLITKLPPKPGLVLGVTNPFFERSCHHWPHALCLGSRKGNTRATANNPSPVGPSPGWRTTHKRFISKDRILLKKVEALCRGGQNDKIQASLLLRRHFSSRAADFLVPLNRYLHTLIPALGKLGQTAPSSCRLKPFSQSDFFASLKAHGSPLPFKSASKRIEFYERWLRSPAFGLWLAHQDKAVEEALISQNRPLKS